MSVYDFSYTAIEGKEVSLSDCKGKVLLIVNTASKCGFTPQYAGLESLYKKYSNRGLVVVGFPCDQFGHQEPGSEEQIHEFCQVRYGVTFPLSRKIEVNGEQAHPLYQYLKSQKQFAGFGKGAMAKMLKLMTKAEPGASDIKWNFTKFLIDRAGNVVGRYEPTAKPEEMAADIEKLLEETWDAN
ncbi:MAG: glutathione peroxidase [Propionibacteriaceae bacterium]|jgi:glutathione peroxidase|nr:glutathione peroxidase [Propionibacteriaceae bacterium]